MKQALTIERMTEQDQQISETVERERVRLRNFIRRRVDDENDADDILQDVFYELVEAYRLMQPIEQVGAWLFRVARNRIIDRFRKRKTKPETLQEEVAVAEEIVALVQHPGGFGLANTTVVGVTGRVTVAVYQITSLEVGQGV